MGETTAPWTPRPRPRAQKGRPMRITIVDSDNESFDQEQEDASRLGIELGRAQATDEDQVIEAARGADGTSATIACLS